MCVCVERERERERDCTHLVVIFFRDLSSSVRVSLPQLDVTDLLDFEDVVADEDATGVTLKFEEREGSISKGACVKNGFTNFSR